MLVLARCRGESVMLGDEIEITICRIDGNQIKLGIAAPRSVKILRTEIWRQSRRRALDAEPTERRSA